MMCKNNRNKYDFLNENYQVLVVFKSNQTRHMTSDIPTYNTVHSYMTLFHLNYFFGMF